MTSQSIGDLARHHPQPLRADDTIQQAVGRLLDEALPALPVVDADGRFAGIFGEREFLSALFPGYLRELKGAHFVTSLADRALEKRDACRQETVAQHMTTDHVEVDFDCSDVELAEIFFHHRVLIVPVVRDGRPEAIITRSDFFRALAQRFVQPDR
jgi:CBS domain-containing protein